MGNWSEAVKQQLEIRCPFCGECRADLLELRGAEWFCNVCSRVWFATTRDDVTFLKVNKIQA